MKRLILVLVVAANLALVAANLALAGAARLLPFAPLEAAKPGDTAAYKLEICDATGRVVSTSEKKFTVDRRDEDTVGVGKMELGPDADAAEIIGALRLLPPGTPLDGLTAKPEATTGPGGKKLEGATHVALRAKLRDGATNVVFDAWFAKEVPVFGLVRSRTKIVGGGAGESAYEWVEAKK